MGSNNFFCDNSVSCVSVIRNKLNLIWRVDFYAYANINSFSKVHFKSPLHSVKVMTKSGKVRENIYVTSFIDDPLFTWCARHATEVTAVGVGDPVGTADLLLVVGTNHFRTSFRFCGTFLEIHNRDQVVSGQWESENV